ncbi:hypothetical protein UlMin_017603 [Ulmus minor]
MHGTRAWSGAPAGSTRDTLGAWSLACCCLAWAWLVGWDGHGLAWPSHVAPSIWVYYGFSKKCYPGHCVIVGKILNPRRGTMKLVLMPSEKKNQVSPCMNSFNSVSKEYKLGPDTLYLTVDMIDRFLSFIYIEKQRLQLLGVACMLIASKYEEICGPRVEDFCFITYNNYSREEVIKMESEVLNLLHFQLSIPTTETFLRFLQAAQSSNKLTLVDYSFLNFLLSLVVAFDVFLARWTLIQSDHPWNYTLEHYTSYKASQLKTTIIAMEDLQQNTNGYSLNAIREKYKQLKHVATLTSKQPIVSLF